eukprot:1963448-Amphidinium_carterae.2
MGRSARFEQSKVFSLSFEGFAGAAWQRRWRSDNLCGVDADRLEESGGGLTLSNFGVMHTGLHAPAHARMRVPRAARARLGCLS